MYARTVRGGVVDDGAGVIVAAKGCCRRCVRTVSRQCSGPLLLDPSNADEGFLDPTLIDLTAGRRSANGLRVRLSLGTPTVLGVSHLCVATYS